MNDHVTCHMPHVTTRFLIHRKKWIVMVWKYCFDFLLKIQKSSLSIVQRAWKLMLLTFCDLLGHSIAWYFWKYCPDVYHFYSIPKQEHFLSNQDVQSMLTGFDLDSLPFSIFFQGQSHFLIATNQICNCNNITINKSSNKSFCRRSILPCHRIIVEKGNIWIKLTTPCYNWVSRSQYCHPLQLYVPIISSSSFIPFNSLGR